MSNTSEALIREIQGALAEQRLDGWLFCDFHNRDHLGLRILGLDPEKMTTRRWYYFVPAQGEPRKLCHKIEPSRLDPLPGGKAFYLSWRELHAQLKVMLAGAARVAMQFSPLNAIPYVALVDAGTVDLVRSFGVEVVSSADLVQRFDALLDERGVALLEEASGQVHAALKEAFALVRERVLAGRTVTERDVQALIADRFSRAGLTCDGALPIVAANAHAGDPHFEVSADRPAAIRRGDFLLIDLWARKNIPEGIYCDITWCGVVDDRVPAAFAKVFRVVAAARDAGVALLEDRFGRKAAVHGFEVDDAVRQVVASAGYGEQFIHRTGHSIGHATHGTGVNIDNLETKDERLVMPGSCFSIEPGIYLPEFGVRSEITVFISRDGRVCISGPRQEALVPILASR